MFENKKVTVLIVLVLSAAVHFAYFGYPNQTVFDEVHFGKFISGYFTGNYFFDIHPPLGKLLISGIGYLSGFKAGFSFANIGEVFPDKQYMMLRLLPTLAGFLLPLIIYFLALKLGLSKRISFLASLFIVFENALTVQSRFILLDSLLLLFGFSALLAYLKHRETDKEQKKLFLRYRWLILAGLLAGLSASVKWTGLGFLALILIFQALDWFSKKSLADLFANFLFLAVIPFVLYFSIFAVHFYLLGKSGPGDAFMSPSFQKSLAGSSYQNDSLIKPVGLVKKFLELNIQMYGSNQRLTAQHPYGSKWYTWPFLVRGVYYWTSQCRNCLAVETPRLLTQSLWKNCPSGVTGVQHKVQCRDWDAMIYFLGNPFIWWSSTIALLALLANFVRNIFTKPGNDFATKFILTGFFLNLLPFIGVSRVMFLYHYLASLIFAILALVYLLNQTKKKGVFAIFLVFTILFFLFFSPLTYGLPLTKQESRLLFWLPNWR